jgi:SAM-dependent methyltransferase
MRRISNCSRLTRTLGTCSVRTTAASRRAVHTASVVTSTPTMDVNNEMNTMLKSADVASVREHYNEYAAEPGDCGGEERAKAWGYNARALGPRFTGLPSSLLSIACGGGCPLSLGVQLRPNSTVVDLGCGAGIDVVTAAMLGGPTCQVIGVDMTEGMLSNARKHAEECGVSERVTLVQAGLEGSDPFFEDELVSDVVDGAGAPTPRMARGSADLVISNGVFNLLNKKARVFHRAFELLKPGGRFQVCICCSLALTIVFVFVLGLYNTCVKVVLNLPSESKRAVEFRDSVVRIIIASSCKSPSPVPVSRILASEMRT